MSGFDDIFWDGAGDGFGGWGGSVGAIYIFRKMINWKTSGYSYWMSEGAKH
jgi:hypothetical protein